MSLSVLLPAGGQSLRLGLSQAKQFQELGNGVTVLDFILDRLHGFLEVSEIVLAIPDLGDGGAFETGLSEQYEKLKVTRGGPSRLDSVRNAFRMSVTESKSILIHDVARPFLPLSVFRHCIETLNKSLSGIAALPSVDSVKLRTENWVRQSLNRETVLMVQTPQIFPREVLAKAYHFLDTQNPGEEFTDEASLVEKMGEKIGWLPGHSLLKKITTLEDLEWARWIYSRLQNGEISLDD